MKFIGTLGEFDYIKDLGNSTKLDRCEFKFISKITSFKSSNLVKR